MPKLNVTEGLTYALADYAKKFNGNQEIKLSKKQWINVMAKVTELNQKRSADNKIFTKGSDLFGSVKENFVVTGKEVNFTEEELNIILAEMGFGNIKGLSIEHVEPEEDYDADFAQEEALENDSAGVPPLPVPDAEFSGLEIQDFNLFSDMTPINLQRFTGNTSLEEISPVIPDGAGEAPSANPPETPQVENEEPVMNNPFAAGTSSTGNVVTTQREYNLEDLLKNDKTLQDFIDIRTNIEVKNKKDKVIATIKDGVFYIDDEVVDEEKFNKYVKRKGETVNIIKEELVLEPLQAPTDSLKVSPMDLAEIESLNPINIDFSPFSTEGEHITVTNQQIKQLVKTISQKYDVDEELILAVIKRESHFKNNAVSHAGAQGLMQLMPATARGLGVEDPFDPQQNIEGGTKLLKTLLKTYNGDVKLALAAYNYGIGNVNRKLSGKPRDIKYIYSSLPSETKNYVREVYANYMTTKETNRGTLS